MRFLALSSLQTKLTVSVLAVLALVSAFMIWFFPTRMMESATRSERDRAEAVAALLGEAVGPGLDFDNEEAVRGLLDGLAATRGAMSALVLREDGTPLAAWRADELVKSNPGNVKTPVVELRGDVLRIARPIKGFAGAKGTLYIQFSLAELELEKSNILRVTLIFSVLLLLGGSALSWWVGGFVARPIVALTEITADVVRSGNLRRKIEARSDDEVGQLSLAFGQMLDTLRDILSRAAALSTEMSAVSQKLDGATRTVATGGDRIAERVKQSTKSAHDMLRSLERVGRAAAELSASANETYTASTEVQNASVAASNNLTEMVAAASTTTEAIDKVARGVSDTAERVTGLDRVIEETRASIADMQRSMEEVRRKTIDTARLSEQMSEDATSGMTAISRTLEGLDQIRSASTLVNDALAQLTTRIAQISDILRVMDEISSQTNLLSLNASIIASQAGESGRAFSVVAQEIKALASRSEGYTGQIEELVERIHSDASAVTTAMNKGLESVERGVDLGRDTERVLESIVRSARSSNGMVQQISSEGEQQVRHVEDVVAAVRRIGDAAKHLSETARKQASETTLISDQSQRVRELTNRVQQTAQAQASAAQQIGGAARTTSSMVESLGQAQSEQRDQSRRVLDAVQAIDVVTQEQRALVNELETTTRALRQQAKDLEEQLQGFEY